LIRRDDNDLLCCRVFCFLNNLPISSHSATSCDNKPPSDYHAI
jgi:hypothetical protein